MDPLASAGAEGMNERKFPATPSLGACLWVSVFFRLLLCRFFNLHTLKEHMLERELAGGAWREASAVLGLGWGP